MPAGLLEWVCNGDSNAADNVTVKSLGAVAVPKSAFSFIPRPFSPLADCWCIKNVDSIVPVGSVKVEIKAGLF